MPSEAMKNFFTVFVLIFMICVTAEAALIEKNSTVAVMDFEPHEGTSSTNLDLLNAEKTSSEYVIYRLAETKKLSVVDRETVQDKLQDLKTSGIIDPATAAKIGTVLGVRYIVYGNVTDVTAATDKFGVNVHRVRAHLMIRIMDVETGRIVMAARGEGQSESAFVGDSDGNFITIGTVKVSQVSVHNALQKAAFQAVDILIQRLFSK